MGMGKHNEIEVALDDIAQQIAESISEMNYAQKRAVLKRLVAETRRHLRDLSREKEAGLFDDEMPV